MPRLRSLACVVLLVLPACVVRLADRNAPEENGGVTGAPADCSQPPAEGNGAPAGDAAPKFVGRFNRGENGTAGFDWSGNYITARFQNAPRVIARIRLAFDETKPDSFPTDLMFAFALDGLPPEYKRITVRTDPVTNAPLNREPLEEYEVIVPNPSEPHELTIYKNTEAQKGGVVFKGFEFPEGGAFLQPTRRPRRMEFIGDSIICGYGNEGKNATCPFEVKVRDVLDPQGNPVMGPNGQPRVVTVPLTENQYLSFTSLAARELDADAVTICWSGKGAYLNYKETLRFNPETGQNDIDPEGRVTVPQLWLNRTYASDETSKWDFATEPPEEVPQVVFISLGTNDFSRDTQEPAPPNGLPGNNVPDGTMLDPNEREQFFQKYLELVQNVRKFRPNAHIFLATPPMVTDQFPLENARNLIREVLLRIVAAMDPKVYQMDLVEQGFRYGLGCDYHPNLDVHRIMAKQLVGAVKSKTCWSR